MEPQEYDVELYDNHIKLATFQTFNSWAIEGDFLVVWDKDFNRHAHRISSNCSDIKTVPVEKLETPTVRGVMPDYGESAE